MNLRPYFSRHFTKQLKELKKRYPHIKEDLYLFLMGFKIERAVPICRSIYKARMKSRDIGRGKSGGLRIYMAIYEYKNLIIPLCIYAKSQLESISRQELRYHIYWTNLEIQIK